MKDFFLLLLGIVAGWYANWSVSKLMNFAALKSSALKEIQLLSAIIDKNSYDFNKGYTLDRLLHALSVDCFQGGHRAASEKIAGLGNRVEKMFFKIRQSSVIFDIIEFKKEILTEAATLSWSWRGILLRDLSSKDVVNFFMKKEQELIQDALRDRNNKSETIEKYNEQK
jgi:hypothetical protein